MNGKFSIEEILAVINGGSELLSDEELKKAAKAANISAAKVGKPQSEEHIAAKAATQIGRIRSDEARANISAGLKGVEKKSPLYKAITCPHCGITGKGGNMKRYHFDRCKQNPENLILQQVRSIL